VICKNTILTATFLSFALIGCSGSEAPGVSSTENVEIALNDVPVDVRNLVMAASPKFTMVEVVKKHRDGRIYFDVEGELPNGNEIEFDILITDDGPKIVEIQRDIRWKTVPKAAKKIVRKANADKAKIVRVIESKQAEADMTVPTGGVIVPIPRASIMMTPKCTGSTPMVCTTGRKIGVTIIMSGAISINVPKTSKQNKTIKSIKNGDSVSPNIKLDIIKGPGRCLSDILFCGR